MKKAYILLAVVAFLMAQTVTVLGQSVPNGDFETWDSGTIYPSPTGWDSPNATLSQFGVSSYVVEQESTSPATGMYSAHLESKSYIILFQNVSVPGFMTLGDFDVDIATQQYSITGGVPFSDRPDKLMGNYKYAPSGADFCLVQVLLFDYDTVNQVVNDTIGEGVFIGGAESSYTSFEVEIDYSSSATPNYMNIIVLSSYSSTVQVGSSLFVDDLEFYTEPSSDPDLFFSEYIEGSSNNKGWEIYNPTSNTIDLANYQIAQATNGGGWSYYHTFPAGASIAPGDVWVIVADALDTTFYSLNDADEVLSYPSVTHHNGDDARALIKIVGSDTTWLDVFGDQLNDPGSGWDVAGVASATANHTLVRKFDITSGNTDWAESFGTDAANSEWIVYDENTFSYLGFHGAVAMDPEITIDYPADGATVMGTDLTVSFTVENFDVGLPTAGLDGHVHYSLDGGSTVMYYSTDDIEFTSLSLGSHQLLMWLVDNNHQTLNPQVADTVEFTVVLSSEAEIVSFSVPGQAGSSIINSADSTVMVYVASGTDLTALIPTIEVSANASISPLSGVVQDFTAAVTYTVTAQDGSTKDWMVSVMIQPEGDLFFSEYVEGSSNNKALEIYNPTSAPISLDSYQIAQAVNGGGWAYYHIFPAGAVIDAGDVYVIITDQFDGSIFAATGADEVLSYPSAVHHNGDDARALIKINGADTTYLDIIGDPLNDPGDGWDVAGVTNATKDHTLVRKAAIIQGNTDWVASAGTDANNSEWEVNPVDYVNLGSHYTGGNLPPVVSNVTILPITITDTTGVTVAATVSDPDGIVASVTFAWGLDGTTFPNAMTLTQIFDVYSIYPDEIPAQPQGTTVYFQYIATDDLGAETIYVGSYTVASDPTIVTIYAIQGQAAASPYDGQIVTTSGIVTGLLPGSSQGYFVQDGAGAWNGVFVYDNVNTPAVGDAIEFTSEVSEYYELTELKNVTGFTIVSSGNTLPDATLLTTNEVNDEAYEGVLVKVMNATCENDDYGYGMWQVNDGSGATLIHNNSSFTYSPSLGVDYDVTGVLNYTFSEWKIELRMASDVSESISINETELESALIYPNPVLNNLNIRVETPVRDIYVINMIGELVYSKLNVNESELEIDFSNFDTGIYMIRLVDENNNMSHRKVIKK